jgi:hypothetical protein
MDGQIASPGSAMLVCHPESPIETAFSLLVLGFIKPVRMAVLFGLVTCPAFRFLIGTT